MLGTTGSNTNPHQVLAQGAPKMQETALKLLIWPYMQVATGTQGRKQLQGHREQLSPKHAPTSWKFPGAPPWEHPGPTHLRFQRACAIRSSSSVSSSIRCPGKITLSCTLARQSPALQGQVPDVSRKTTTRHLKLQAFLHLVTVLTVTTQLQLNCNRRTTNPSLSIHQLAS